MTPYPPSVEDKLIDLGISLKKPVEMLGMWAIEHQQTIHKARESFDKKARYLAQQAERNLQLLNQTVGLL